MQGAYILPHGWRDNPAFRPAPHTEREAYIWLDENRGAAGLLVVSVGALKNAWGWKSTGRVRSYLIKIKDAGLIDFEEDQSPILVRIVNPATVPSHMPDGVPGFSLCALKERRVRSEERRPGIPAKIARAVYARDGMACVYCGCSGGSMHLDHIHPWSKGGAHTVKNLCVACADCNQSKSDKSLCEWRALS